MWLFVVCFVQFVAASVVVRCLFVQLVAAGVAVCGLFVQDSCWCQWTLTCVCSCSYLYQWSLGFFAAFMAVIGVLVFFVDASNNYW